MTEDAAAHVLVADDEPVSLEYLLGALRELGFRVDGAANGGQALIACATATYDLLLLDRRMPDLGGVALLRELRRKGCDSIAIATSAELDAAMRAQLVQAGYADTLTKPIGVERLAALLAAHLPHWNRQRPQTAASSLEVAAVPMSSSAVIEDGAALASVGGDRQTLQSLRGLFASELEAALPRIAVMPAGELGDWLHRLRASCRYCGAVRLGNSAEKLERRLKAATDGHDRELAEFIDIVQQTLDALANP